MGAIVQFTELVPLKEQDQNIAQHELSERRINRRKNFKKKGTQIVKRNLAVRYMKEEVSEKNKEEETISRVVKLTRDTKNNVKGMAKRQVFTVILMFPIQIFIVFADYWMFKDYKNQAELIQGSLEVRTSLHYLNGLNYEAISTGKLMMGRVDNITESPEVILTDYIVDRNERLVAKFIQLDRYKFPNYLSKSMDTFEQYMFNDFCKLGGITPISYLESCMFSLISSLQLLRGVVEGNH